MRGALLSYTAAMLLTHLFFGVDIGLNGILTGLVLVIVLASLLKAVRLLEAEDK